jgi:hypothetical protein
MIVVNATDNTPTITILPKIKVTYEVDGISGYYLEFIDDETQEIFTFGSGDTFEIEGDFFQIDINNSNGDLKAEKYYTLRMINSTTKKVVYRDKAFVTSQNPTVKYDNNKDQYIKADTGNNDYILL